MLREKISKGQNSPDLDIGLGQEIENFKPAQREMSDLFLKRKELKTKISEMNSIWNEMNSICVTFSELCKKSYCGQFRFMTFARWCSARK